LPPPWRKSLRQNRFQFREYRSGAGSGAGAGEMHDPVGLPTRAAVRREGLLPPRRGSRDLRPAEPHLDRPAVEGLIGEEGSAPVLEAAAHRRVDGEIPRIEPPDQPLAGLLVEGADAHGAIGPAGQLE